MKILIFSDKLSNYSELCAGARKLGGDTIAFFIGDKNDATKIGASKVFQADIDSTKIIEDYFAALKDIVINEKPDAVLIGSTKRGKYFAACLAATMGTSTLTDLNNISIDGGAVKGTQMYYGGVALRTLKSKGLAIVTVGAGVFEADGNNSASEVVNVAIPANDGKIIVKSKQLKEGKTINLVSAKKVVAIGRGVIKKEDIAHAEAFATAVGAELGCTRPIAEGEGWMDVGRYIGVSGVILKPDVYVAIGISGQVQHTIGINAAKIIIAINKDKNSPIFKCCDYGIVGDLYKILPKLTELAKS